MAKSALALSIAKAVARILAAIALVVFLGVYRTISWALALLFVILMTRACVSEASIWPAAACFGVLVVQHLIVAFLPLESLDRRSRLQQRDRT